MISIYNSYAPRHAYVRASEPAGRRSGEKMRSRPSPNVPKAPPDVEYEKPQGRGSGTGESSLLSALIPKGILPAGIDISDIMLGAVLLLLYLDSKDEEFLIILAVVALSVLKPEGKK